MWEVLRWAEMKEAYSDRREIVGLVRDEGNGGRITVKLRQGIEIQLRDYR